MLNKVNRLDIIFMMLMALLLASCATTPQEQFTPAEPIIERPLLIKVPNKNNYHLRYGNDPALEHAFNHYAKNGKAANIITDGFVKFAYNTGQQPIVNTSPFQETVISLEPGEKFTNISSGDPNRWSYAVAVSGSGVQQQQHVLVKPSLPDISTNMVITTDKRIYNLKLLSSNNARAIKNISFWYPDEMVIAANEAAIKEVNDAQIASVPDVDLQHLNFNYRVSCGTCCHMPSWAPTRIFDDGKHTYIQFPRWMNNRDMPVLFVSENNHQALVNYRAKSPYFIVDKIFKQALLMTGVGRSQVAVTIINTCYQ